MQLSFAGFDISGDLRNSYVATYMLMFDVLFSEQQNYIPDVKTAIKVTHMIAAVNMT